MLEKFILHVPIESDWKEILTDTKAAKVTEWLKLLECSFKTGLGQM